jgi:hypothetical protein
MNHAPVGVRARDTHLSSRRGFVTKVRGVAGSVTFPKSIF